MCRHCTSWPASRSSSAATAESTPPDSATIVGPLVDAADIGRDFTSLRRGRPYRRRREVFVTSDDARHGPITLYRLASSAMSRLAVAFFSCLAIPVASHADQYAWEISGASSSDSGSNVETDISSVAATYHFGFVDDAKGH